MAPGSTPLAPNLSTTEVQGIFQGDIIIRKALTAAIADIRANPQLLDYVWAGLPKDSLSSKEYGQLELSEAKKWILQHEFPVKMAPAPQEGRWHCLTIQLVGSQEIEAESTLSDVHYTPSELNDSSWPTYAGPFTPLGYNPATGIITAPPGVVNPFALTTNMFIVDRFGKAFPITTVNDDGTFGVAPGTETDFTGAIIKTERPGFITSLESSSFRETYRIGVHTGSEPVYLFWLHSVLVFILLRYKQVFLEARGFERTTISSSDFARDPNFEIYEGVYSRYVTVTGYCRNFWPKFTDLRISTTVPEIMTDGGSKSPSNVNPNTELWFMDQDALTPKK